MSDIKYLSKEQSNKLIESISIARHRVIVLLMLDCGLRVSETISLKYNDFDFKNKLVIVRSLKKHKKETRKVPLSSRLYQELAKFLSKRNNVNPNDYLFPNRSDNSIHITRSAVSKFLANLNKKNLHFDFLNPHCLRHSFGTHHISNGTPLENIKTMLGHVKYDTTLIYSKIPVSVLRENIDKVTSSPKSYLKKFLDSVGISFSKKYNKKINISFYKEKFSIGRNEEFKTLENNANKGINTLILGNIGVGKSHLLEHFQTDKKVLRIDDLFNIKSSLTNMLVHLYDNDKKHVRDLIYSDIPNDKLQVKLTRNSVRNLTKEICELVTPKEYIIAIDSVDRISPKGVEMIEFLKDHFIIFAAARSVKIDRSSFAWNFDRLQLKELSRTKSFELINKLSFDIEVEDTALFRNHVFEQSNGNPRVIFEIIERYKKEPIITNEVIREIRHTASLKEIDLTFVVFIAFGLMYLLRYLSREVNNDSFRFIGGAALVMALLARQFLGFTKRKFI
jgi:integrase/recombinase XerD